MALEDQIQRVADELEIRNVMARLAQLADDGDLDEYITLFAEDASWESTAFGVRKGHEDLLAGARERRAGGTSGPGTNSRHVLTTTAIDVQGDVATGKSVFHFYTNTHTEPVLSIMGVYADEFRRTPDGWKLARRVIHAP